MDMESLPRSRGSVYIYVIFAVLLVVVIGLAAVSLGGIVGPSHAPRIEAGAQGERDENRRGGATGRTSEIIAPHGESSTLA